MTHPAEKVTDVLTYPPKKPKNGWRVWRDHLTMAWHIEFYEDEKLTVNQIEETNFKARLKIQDIINNGLSWRLDEEEKHKLAIAEIFNEADE